MNILFDSTQRGERREERGERRSEGEEEGGGVKRMEARCNVCVV